MRTIDRYIGIPLCLFICNLYNLKEHIFKPKIKETKKVLFIELSEMGSAILADPAMRWIKKKSCDLHFVIFEKNSPSLELLKTIPADNIYKIRSNNLITLAIDTFIFLLWCRRKHIDSVIDLELFSRITSLMSRMSGAVNRIGFDSVHEEGLYRGNHLTHPVMYNPHIHISKNFMSLVQASHKSGAQPYQRNFIDAKDINLAQANVCRKEQQNVIEKIKIMQPHFELDKQRLILINPNGSDLLPQRRWMADRFATVIRTILTDYTDTIIIITGALSEQEDAETLRNKVDNNRCINSAGGFLFSELVPLYSISLLMLSNDSGPPHFASVTKLPTFVLFGPETPNLYCPIGNTTPIYKSLACSPCVSAGNHRKTTCTDNQCLKSIHTEDVLKAIRPILNRVIIKTR